MSLDGTDFDYVIVGTGFVNSLLSAALAQRGERILHLDTHATYGYNYPCFCFDDAVKLEGQNYSRNFKNFTIFNNLMSSENNEPLSALVAQALCENDKKQLASCHFRKLSSKFVFDLVPKLIWNNSGMIDSIIKSRIDHHFSFMAHGRTYIKSVDEEVPILVPYSRSDVFESSQISLVEKRLLVKFVTSCASEETELIDKFPQLSQLFDEFSLTTRLRNIFLNYIETENNMFVDSDTTSTEHFLKKILKIGDSYFRFNSDSPYMMVQYGTNEFCQAFCRVSATFNTVFILSANIKVRSIDEGDFKYELDINNDLNVKTKRIIVEPLYIDILRDHMSFVPSPIRERCLARAVLISTDSFKIPSVRSDEDEIKASDLLSLLNKNINTEIGTSSTILLQQSSKLMVVPYNLRMVHLFKRCQSSDCPKKVLMQDILDMYNIDRTDNKDKPLLLFALYFTQSITTENEILSYNDASVFITSEPQLSFDLDVEYEMAKKAMNLITKDDQLLKARYDVEP